MDIALVDALVHACRTSTASNSLDPALTKKVYYHLSNHLMLDDKLFFKQKVQGGIRVLHVPSHEEVPTIFEFFHSSRFASHFAVKHTLNRL